MYDILYKTEGRYGNFNNKKSYKKYDKVEVLRNINMHVTEGEIYGLIGKNGAGKTTLMKAILGLTDIAGGEIKLWGKL